MTSSMSNTIQASTGPIPETPTMPVKTPATPCAPVASSLPNVKDDVVANLRIMRVCPVCLFGCGEHGSPDCPGRTL